MENISTKLNRSYNNIDVDYKVQKVTYEDESIKRDREKYLINQIMNYLHYSFRNIDLYSTYELERIIIYSGYNKHKTMSLLENCSKEEIIKLIEDWTLRNLRKSHSVDNNCFKVRTHINLQKEYYKIKLKNHLEGEEIGTERAWEFLKRNINLIDLKDFYQSYDHFKLIKKAKSIAKEKNDKKLNVYIERFYDIRERKTKEMFKANLEENDITFLTKESFMQNEVAKKHKKMIMNNMTDKILNSVDNLYPYFINSGELVKSNILEYLDIHSIGKFGLCSKTLYQFVFKKYNLEKRAKTYCLAIFKNTSNYLNNQERIKSNYKNYMAMLIKRPRIRYGGIYYSRVKYSKVGDSESFGEQVISTVTYFRFYRFFPNGEIYSITTPWSKTNKLLTAIQKNNVEVRKGRFFIDNDDTLFVEIHISKSVTCQYKYKIKEIKELQMKFNVLELIEYCFKKDHEVTPIKSTEYFPRLFKFRSLDVLKDEIILSTTYE